MKLLVLKFGGSSLSDVDRIFEVSKIVLKKIRNGYSPIVVVSAMGKTTDKLLEKAYQLCSHPSKREIDLLLSTGEIVSASLFALALQNSGVNARALNCYQAGIFTDFDYGKAKIIQINTEYLLQLLHSNIIPVVAGYQGVTHNNEITTLGRGGSDITAVAIAAALGLKYCEIYTDVEGVFTADPVVVPEAQKLDRISYEEMLEMAGMGAKVLHPRAVLIAQNNNITIHVRSSFSDSKGTFVDDFKENRIVAGVVYNSDEARITFENFKESYENLFEIFSSIASQEVNIELIAKNYYPSGRINLTITVKKEELLKLVHHLHLLSNKIKARRLLFDTEITRVAIIGSGMKNCPGVAAKMFEALCECNVKVNLISTSDIKVSCIVDSSELIKAVRTIHNKFKLYKGAFYG